MKPGAPSRLSLKGRALQLLSQREHSRHELRAKLLPYEALAALPLAGGAGAVQPAPVFERSAERRRGAAPEVAERVEALLDWLEAHAYLSDARFVDSRVRTRAPRLGTMRIQHELARLGTKLSPETMGELKSGEASRAATVWQRKFGEPPVDAAGRARQMRFLAARGFDPEIVRRVVPACQRRESGEPADDE